MTYPSDTIILDADEKGFFGLGGFELKVKSRLGQVHVLNLTKSEANLIRRYIWLFRNAPDKVIFNNKISSILRRIIEPVFIKATGSVPDVDTHFVICSDDKKPWIVSNIPWEASALTSSDPRNFSDLLASFPIVRSLTSVTPNQPRQIGQKLKVLCCISSPEDDIRADEFSKSIREIFQKRNSLLTAVMLDEDGNGRRYRPTKDELLNQMSTVEPNIFILVSHGQTTKKRAGVKLGDGWIDLAILTNRLKSLREIYLVILICCDLTHSEQGSPVQTGALDLNMNGIPAVLAMQSSILALHGITVIKGILEHLFTAHRDDIPTSLPKALAHARRNIVDTMMRERQFAEIDWLFPTLFISDYERNPIHNLYRFIDLYDTTLRIIKANNFGGPVESYFSRPQLEKDLTAMLLGAQAGIGVIRGNRKSGKTTLINYCVTKLYEQFIADKTTNARQVIYLDMGHRKNQGVGEFLISLKAKIDILIPQVLTGRNITIDPTLPELVARQTQADGPKTLIEHVLKMLDNLEILLIVDNLTKDTLDQLLPLFQQALSGFLESSFIIIACPHELDFTSNNEINIEPLTQVEVQEYCTTFSIENPLAVYQEIGGSLPHLDAWRQGIKLSLDADVAANELVSKLETLQDDNGNNKTQSLLILSLFAHGTKGTFNQSIGIQEDDTDALVKSDLLVSMEIEGEKWFFVPGRLAEKIRELFEEYLDTAAGLLTERFVSWMNEDTEAKLYSVLRDPGGVIFIRQISEALAIAYKITRDEGILSVVRSIPLLSHETLFSQGKWYDCYLLWMQLHRLDGYSPAPREYLALGKCCHILGLYFELKPVLDHCCQVELSPIEKIDYLSLKASYFKDIAAHEKKAKIIEYYEEALCIAENLNDLEKKALLLYNRAIFIRWWLHDLDRAVNDMTTAKSYYKKSNLNMFWVSCSEEADMLMDTGKLSAQELKLLLIQAQEYFKEKRIEGDLALTQFRIAKLYKRTALQNNTRPDDAKGIYEDALLTAESARLMKLQFVIRCHLFILNTSYYQLPMNDRESIIDSISEDFPKFSSDSWVARNYRDAVWAAIDQSQEGSTSWQKKMLHSIALAAKAPHSPESQTDKGRLSFILSEYIRACKDKSLTAMIDELLFSAEIVDWGRWFPNFDPLRNSADDLLNLISTLIKKPLVYG